MSLMPPVVREFQQSLQVDPPWQSIVDFACHKSFCGRRMYPRQLTLLKLIYLEKHNWTQYDWDIIGGWAESFKNRVHPIGVQPDIFDRVDYLLAHGYHHFTHVQMVGGRRGSKGVIGGITGAERLAFLYSVGDWQSYFGFIPGTVAELAVVATNQSQAAKRQFRDVRLAVQNCEYLKRDLKNPRYTDFYIQTPWDRQFIDQKRSENVAIDPDFSSLYAIASSAVSTAQRGGAGIANMYDEFAHLLMGSGSVKSGEEIFEAMQPSLDQFGVHALTYTVSSPFTMVGKFFDLYEEGTVLLDSYLAREGMKKADALVDIMDDEEETTEADPSHLVMQFPSWELYTDWEKSTQIPLRKGKRCGPPFRNPVQYPPEGDRPENIMQRRRKIKNPEKFAVEREAQFATVQDAYLDPNKVEAMFERPWWYTEDLAARDHGKLAIIYRGHGDPSKSNANFGFAICHLENSPCDGCGYAPDPTYQIGHASPHLPKPWEHNCKKEVTDHAGGSRPGRIWPVVMVDYLHVWKPENYPGHTLDYEMLREEIVQVVARFPSMKKLSYDQANSIGFISHQKRVFPSMRVVEVTFTPKENWNRFEKFKTALNMGLIKSYKDTLFEDGRSLLELELKFLQEKNGKVDKMDFGPVTTKDLSDAVMVCAVDLLSEHLDRWYNGANLPVFGSTNVAGLRHGREFDRLHAQGFGAPTVTPSPTATRTYSDRAARNHQVINDRRRELEQGSRYGFSGRERPMGSRGMRPR